MAINAVIRRPNIIVANSAPITTTQSMPAISLKNNVGGPPQNYVHNLLDVVEDNPVTGSTLVYNAATDKYEVKLPEFAGSVDGGSF
jgi:hypothetical protein